MLIKGSRKYNYRHNSLLADTLAEGAMINGQGLGAVSEFRYGICRMSFNGCEVIAVYNALIYLKKPKPLSEIAFYMERFRLLSGFFGCNVYKVGKALEYFGADCVYDRDLSEAKAFVVSFWTGRPLMSSIHTVFCIRCGNETEVYNRYNNRGQVYRCRTLKEITCGRKPISAYVLKIQ